MKLAPHIMIVEDEPEIAKCLTAALENGGYYVLGVSNGVQALKAARAKPPDLILLDLGLPDGDGKDVLRRLRTWTSLPVIVLSARDHEIEKVAALELGADDYLTKPFSMAELFARLKVALRHAGPAAGPEGYVYDYAGLKIDLEKRLVKRQEELLHLTPTEYKLLVALAKHAGKVVTQTTLIHEVWGQNSQGNTHYLRIYVQHLRNKLKDDPLNPTYILTEAGIGYRLAVAA